MSQNFASKTTEQPAALSGIAAQPNALTPPHHASKTGASGEASKAQDILVLENISKNFGGVQAIENVNFSVRRGEIFGLIGPNGAGKTTLLNIITGAYKPSLGEVFYAGGAITRRSQQARARLGIARTFQNIRLFESMSVLENVLVPQRPRYSLAEAFLHIGRYARAEELARTKALWLLERVGILELANERVSELSYGQQRLAEIARSLALDPALLLLDEPAAGMNASESAQLAQTVQNLRAQGLSVLLIEHDMAFIKRLCDRVLVLDYGRTITIAPPAEALASPEVIAAYLGEFDAKSE